MGKTNKKNFNVTGPCLPNEHYMADISDKLKKIKKLVDNGCYFTINRAEKHGKTTLLSNLKRFLEDEYTCVYISFKEFDENSFESPGMFCKSFIEHTEKALQFTSVTKEYICEWKNYNITDFGLLGAHITEMCRGKKIVLMVDDVDKAGNYQVFLTFLGMLRNRFQMRKSNRYDTFHSVIFAGVHNVNDFKQVREEYGHKFYDSPWNIAVNFDVDLTLSCSEIAGMLSEYEKDYNTGMDIAGISEEIRRCTSGYPYIVSLICRYINNDSKRSWTVNGVQNAVEALLAEGNKVFGDILRSIEPDTDFYHLIYDILITGTQRNYELYNEEMKKGIMLGIIRCEGYRAVISNRIYELLIRDYLTTEKRRIKIGFESN